MGPSSKLFFLDRVVDPHKDLQVRLALCDVERPVGAIRHRIKTSTSAITNKTPRTWATELWCRVNMKRASPPAITISTTAAGRIIRVKLLTTAGRTNKKEATAAKRATTTRTEKGTSANTRFMCTG